MLSSAARFAGRTRGAGAPRSFASQARVLVLGAGLVARPLVEYLARPEGQSVTVVSGVPGEAEGMVQSKSNVTPLTMDVTASMDTIHALIEESDLIVSLLPAPMHIPIAESCISTGTDLVSSPPRHPRRCRPPRSDTAPTNPGPSTEPTRPTTGQPRFQPPPNAPPPPPHARSAPIAAAAAAAAAPPPR